MLAENEHERTNLNPPQLRDGVQFASLIGDRVPIVLLKQLPGLGNAKRYVIAIVDDDRAPLDKFCKKLTAAGSTCNVMRNEIGP